MRALSRRDRHSLYNFLQIGERGEGPLLQIGERAGANHDAGPQAQQRLVQFRPVVRKIQADLAGHRINRRPIRGFERCHVTVRGVPHANQVAQGEMHIVEEIGHKALGGDHGRSFFRRYRRRLAS